MDRKTAVQRVALLVGGAIAGADIFIQTGCKPKPKTAATKTADVTVKDFFTKEEIAYLDEVAETILPRTTTPGAKDAKVGAFMNVMVRDCYTEDQQEIFKNGIKELENTCNKKLQKGFMGATPEERTQLLTALDKEAKKYQKEKDIVKPEQKKSQKEVNNYPPQTVKTKGDHYFTMMKSLTLLGFFTSEPGATKALRYAAVPGKYDGYYPYHKGDKAWAT